METIQTITPPKPSQTANNLPKSLFGSTTGQVVADTTGAGKTPENGSQGQPGPTPSNTGGSGTGPLGATVSANDALSGLKHTEIPVFSQSDSTGATGSEPVTPLGASQNVALGGLIEGKWAVEIMDALLPSALVSVCYMIDVKLRKSELQLTQKEKDVIAPIMQKCLDSILLNFNSPWTALYVTIGAIYGGKLMEKGVVAWVDKKEAKQQAEALAAKVEAARPETNIANQSAADIMNGNVSIPGRDPWTEDEVKQVMRSAKISRDKAIKRLEKKYGLRK